MRRSAAHLYDVHHLSWSTRFPAFERYLGWWHASWLRGGKVISCAAPESSDEGIAGGSLLMVTRELSIVCEVGYED